MDGRVQRTHGMGHTENLVGEFGRCLREPTLTYTPPASEASGWARGHPIHDVLLVGDMNGVSDLPSGEG